MQSKKLEEGYVIKLEKGEEIVESLAQFCAENYIKSGMISGIGGSDDVSIKYFDKEKKEYINKKFNDQDYEIISLTGNISLIEEKPFPHIHIMIGDSEYKTFGGHLGFAVISITCEIFIITAHDDTINRKMDEEFKLNFLDL
ncbi:MAG: PPC domain-containing DNA-binding protein [Candidatus Paceibacterota bacterium]|jgi:hypothetical protein